MDALLVCPDCASEHGGGERFCPSCGMPLVRGERGGRAVTERQRRARKIKPEYAQGPLVQVTWARNQPEAELYAGMLLEEGIPSLMRRPAGFDVPDFMASGPRDLLVPQSALAAARDVLATGESAAEPPLRRATPRATQLLTVMVLVLVLTAVALFMATHVWD
jgi:hypothetical protein